MINNNNAPLVSILIFGKESTELSASELETLTKQSYKNIEYFIVNNKKNHLKQICDHLKKANGKYLYFWCIDSHLSIDLIRSMVVAADANDVDLTIAKVAKESKGKKFFYNLDPTSHDNTIAHDDNIVLEFLNFHFKYIGYYAIDNKLINARIVDKIIPLLEEYIRAFPGPCHYIYTHLLSFILWLTAKSKINIQEYVYKHIEPVSIPSKLNVLTEYIKFLNFIESQSIKFNSKFSFQQLKTYVGKYIISTYQIEGFPAFDKRFENYFEMQITALSDNDQYYHSILTEFSENYYVGERIKAFIASEKCKIVSFDMFDTLIYRPFSDPKDLFCLLSSIINSKSNSSTLIDYAYFRQIAESKARQQLVPQKKNEISLDDIYNTMHYFYNVPIDICQEMKDLEIKLEISLCKAKEAIKALYNMSVFFNKTILITTDIYHTNDTLIKILEKNGYYNYKLFASSEYNACKHSGELFNRIIQTFDVKDDALDSIIHIGDNYTSDFNVPKTLGLNAKHINSAFNYFKGGNKSFYGGESFQNIYRKNTFFRQGKWATEHYWGLRTFHGIVANTIFDDPFVAVNKKSDFNADPYYIGYYCLGGLLLGVTRWILDEIKNKNVGTIHFVARDGWALKRFYDIYSKSIENAPKSNYLYVSRKSLLTADLQSVEDLLAFVNNKVNVSTSTPQKIIAYLKPIIKPDSYKKIVAKYARGKSYVLPFERNENYFEFINGFIKRYKNSFDFTTYRENCRNYFASIIKPGDVLFDIGYSGRTEAILSNLLGFAVNGFYIHSNGEILNARENAFGFTTKCFYQWRPNITGVVREHLLMKYSQSVTGYNFNNTSEVIFDNCNLDNDVAWLTNRIQDAAMDFCRDLTSDFGQYLKFLYANNYDLALPCEYYIQLAKPLDRSIFSILDFEDDIGAGKSKNACEFWDEKYKGLVKDLLPIAKSNTQTNTDSQKIIVNTSIMKQLISNVSLPTKPTFKIKTKRTNKILLYSNELSWSGAPRSLLRICKVLLKYGYSVEVWSLFDGELRDEYNKLGVKVTICDYNNANYARATQEFDMCIVNAAVSYKFYYIIKDYLPTVWYIREATNLKDLCIGNPGLEETLQDSIDIVCVSEYAKNHITNTYNRNCLVVPNCIEDKYKNYIKPRKNKITILTLGTIEPRKGYDVILNALELLPLEYASKIEFKFAGRVLDFCKDWAEDILKKAAKMDNVIYLGNLTSEDDLYSAYCDTDVVVVASRDESCSLVALEGAMHGKPLIVTENTGAKYMVNENNGFIVKTANANDLANKLQFFIDNPSLIDKMGQISRSKYEALASMEYYEKCILNLIKNKLKIEPINIQKPITNKNIVPIIMATDQNYAYYAKVAIQSILAHASNDTYYDIYVFYSELGDDTIKALSDNTSNHRVVPLNITSMLSNDLELRVCAHYSIETYFRFFAPEILAFYDKIVYVDCDLILLEDVKKLFEIDLNGKMLGAVHNYMNDFVVKYVRSLGLEPENYFNAGVLLIDTKKLADNKIRDRAFKLLSEHPEFIMLDQDALNIVCKNDILFLSKEWNVQWHHFEKRCDIVIDRQNCIDAYSNPKILHFTGKNKPWNNPKTPLSHLFWKFAQDANCCYEIIKKQQPIYIKDFTIQKSDSIASDTSYQQSTKKGILYYLEKFINVTRNEGFTVAVKKSCNTIRRKIRKKYK